jgi:hypothetical protein
MADICKPTYNGKQYESIEEIKALIIQEQGFMGEMQGDPQESVYDYKTKDIQYMSPEKVNNLLFQIPELSELSKRAAPLIAEMNRMIGLLSSGSSESSRSLNDKRRESGIPIIFPYRLFSQFVTSKKSTPEKKQTDIQNYENQLTAFEQYMNSGITDDDLIAIAEKYNKIDEEKNALVQKSIEQAAERRQQRQLLLSVAKPFVDFIKSKFSYTDNFDSTMIEMLEQNVSKRDIYKTVSFLVKLSEAENDYKASTDDTRLRREDLSDVYKIMKKFSFDINSIPIKSGDMFKSAALSKLKQDIAGIDNEADKYDFKEGNLAEVPVLIDNDLATAEARLEELRILRDQGRAQGGISPDVAQEILRVKEFINDKKGIDSAWLVKKKQKLGAFKDALKDVRDSNTNLGFAYNPKDDAERKTRLLSAAIEVIQMYVEEGITRFSDIVEDAMKEVGDTSRDFLNALKTAYINLVLNGEKLPDSIKDVSEYENASTFDGLPGKIDQEQKEKLEEVLEGKKTELDVVENSEEEDAEAKKIDIQGDIDKINQLFEKGIDLYEKFRSELATSPVDAFEYLRRHIVSQYLYHGKYEFKEIVTDMNRVFPVEEYFDYIKLTYMSIQSSDTDGYSNLMEARVNYDYDSIFNVQDPKNTFVEMVLEAINNKEKFSIVRLRQMAVDSGIDSNIKDTTLQEYAELAIVKKAREISFDPRFNQREKYSKIVDLYENQPTISMRSNERIENQQYSTPIPMGFAMGVFVNAAKPKRLLEPSAGNGMLIYPFPQNVVTVNEIDPIRRENLSDLGYQNIMSQDAMNPIGGNYDAIVMNPPFASAPARKADGHMIEGMDPIMVANALSSMDDNGRAAIIIGGNNTYTKYGVLSGKGEFFQYLYNTYNVVDVINMKGDMYRKQGTSFPTRIILINGRRPPGSEKKYPPALHRLLPEQAKVVDNWDELFNRIKKVTDEQLLSPKGNAPSNSGGGGGGASANTGRSNTFQGSLFDPADTSGGDGPVTSSSGRVRPGSNGPGRPGDTRNNQGDRPISTPVESSQGAETNQSTQERIDIDIIRNQSLQLPDGADAIDISQGKVDYVPQSQSPQIGSKIPVNMASPLYSILRQFGDIDSFVQQRLNYPTKEALYKALAAEQIDSVALAIYQIEQGKALVIGDSTGVGKGRQAAAIIRYAILQGKKPVFVTLNSKLFSDMYGDLLDIGSEYRPLIINSSSTDNVVDVEDPKKILHKAHTSASIQKIMKMDSVPDEYDFVMATYSQFSFNEEKNPDNYKKKFVEQISKDNIFIFDESHSMSAGAPEGRGGAEGELGGTAGFFRKIIPLFSGGTFLSATFAKKPQNMPAYALKTDISKANMGSDELIASILKGGVPLQEVMSANLVKAGQMVRRERDFTGVSFEWKELIDSKAAHEQTFDKVIELFNDVIHFQRQYVQPIMDAKGEALAEESAKLDNKGTKDFGISNTPFASRTFNAVRQLLFSLISENIADEAISQLKQGRKPVIAVANTMESFLKDMGYSYGDTIENVDFSIVLNKGLESVFKYQETRNKVPEKKVLPITALSPSGLAEYQRLRDKINSSVSGITISPIDHIISKIKKAGYKVGEVTGRDSQILFSGEKPKFVKRTDRDKNVLVGQFNSGELDVLILNQSGSTGLSAHASVKFKDQRQRVMIMAQAQLDVNIEIQMMGRIDRTGQIVRGMYIYMMSSVPAQQRLLMMLKAKLKSLNANTTGSQESDTSDLKVSDFINKYGDKMVAEYLFENPHINEKILDPLGMGGKEDFDMDFVKDGAANSVTGKVALLNVKEQEDFYNEVGERYRAFIDYLNENGLNDLEMKTLDLQAETKNVKSIVQGTDNNNPFAEDTYLEEVEMNVLKKPMRSSEILSEISNVIGGEFNPENKLDFIQNMIKEIESYFVKRKEGNIVKINESYDQKEASLLEKATVQVIKEAERLGMSEEDTQTALQELEMIMDFNRKISNKQDASSLAPRIDTIINFKYPESAFRSNFKEAHFQLTERRVNALYFSDIKARDEENKIKGYLRSFSIGKVYRSISVKDDEKGANAYQTVPAVFMGFSYRPSNFRLSAVKAIFATKDGRRKISIPLSQNDVLDYMTTMGADLYVNLENWDDSLSNATRKKGYIITGNLIQSYGVNRSGQIVSFTDSKGNVRQGILMPDTYDPADQAVRLGIDKVVDKIISGEKVVSTNLEVTVEKKGPRMYDLRVPASQKSGSKYYMNKDMQQYVKDGYFRQVGTTMSAEIYEDNLEDAMKFMASKYGLMVNVTPEQFNQNKMKSREIPNVNYNQMVDDMIRNRVVERVDTLTEKPCK